MVYIRLGALISSYTAGKLASAAVARSSAFCPGPLSEHQDNVL